MNCILDDAYEFLYDHVAAPEAILVAQTAVAAATHAMRQHVTFPRVLWTSEREESGKTHAMMMTAALSANPVDASGTRYALDAALLAASNEPERPVPTLYLDEISDVFGRAGVSGSSNPVAEILRKGYKRGATRSASVNRVRTEYSVFTPFFMAGLATAVPRDIRSRCIVLHMTPGKPKKYYDVREGEPYAHALAGALSGHVKRQQRAIASFRARGLHPALTGRKLEIWEPLLAVASALGGQRWLNLVVDAFASLALDEPDVPPLTPREMVTRDCAVIAAMPAYCGSPFITSGQISDELRRMDNPLYADRTEHSLACLVRDSVDVQSGRVRTADGVQVRAYRRADLVAAWEAIRPVNPDDAVLPEDTDDLSDLEDWDEQPFPETDETDAVSPTFERKEPVTCTKADETDETDTFSVQPVDAHPGDGGRVSLDSKRRE